MGLTNEKLLKYHPCFKFDEEILNKLKNFQIKNSKDKKERTKFKKLCFKIKKLFKPCISNDTILLFYENPEEFFNSYENLIEKTSFYDDSGNSIFVHYFYALYDLYKEKNEINSDNIYEKNFNNFFTKEAKFLSIQDLALETPLHKLAKFIDKKFFFYICKKLKDINVLSEELLLINNIDEKSCFYYVLQEIKENKNKIIQKDFEIYKEFFNYYPDLIKSLSLEEKKLFILFSSLITFDEQKLINVDFNNAIEAIYNLIKINSDILNIFQFLYYPEESGINYLNSLYQICTETVDFDKLFQLILDLSNIGPKNKNEIIEKLCISDHISYVLGKMNSSKTRGNKEINYGMKLLNQIMPILIKGESNENIMNIISVRKKLYKNNNMNFNNKGIFKYLIYNQNLTFEQKCDIIKTIKEKFGNYLDDIFDKDFFYLYQLFDAIDKNEINEMNISDKFKENIFVQKIFVDFYIIGDLYREVYNALKQDKEININEYISLLNGFISNNYQELFDKYRLRYNMRKNKIQIIMKLIISFHNQNYSNNTEVEYISKNFGHKSKKNYYYLENLYRKFMLGDPRLVEILLDNFDINDIRKMKDFIHAFFSFNYDFEKILNINNEKIIESLNKLGFNSIDIKNKKIHLIANDYFVSMFKKSLNFVKGKNYEMKYYRYFLKVFKVDKLFKKEISTFKFLMGKYLNLLLYQWEKECEFSELIKFINDNIHIFTFIFLRKKDSFQESNDKINFFFKEFIKALNPNFENQFELNLQQALDFIDLKDETKYDEILLPINYLSLILIFVRAKFGKFNPQLLFLFFCKYNQYINFIYCNFISHYLENHFGKALLYHYFFTPNELITDDNYKIQIRKITYLDIHYHLDLRKNDNLLHYMPIFCMKNLYKLQGMKNSLLFYYMQKILEKLIDNINRDDNPKKDKEDNGEDETNSEKNELEFDVGDYIVDFKPEIYKSFILDISQKQDENIYNLTKSLFISDLEKDFRLISVYSFLEIPSIEFNKERISHNINILKQLSIDLIPKTENIKVNFYIFYDFNKEKVDDNTLLNLYRILYFLKEKNDNLLNCIKTNKYIVMYTFNFLLRNFYFCLAKIFDKEKKYKNELNSLNEKYNYIFDELVNFANFFNKNENNFYEKNDELSISKCLGYIFVNYQNFLMFFKQITKCFQNIKSKIFFNRKSINLKEITDFLEKDIFMLIFYFYKYFHNYNKEEKSNIIYNEEISSWINFIFEHFLFSINPEIQKKYMIFHNLFKDLISIESNLNKNQKSLFTEENNDGDNMDYDILRSKDMNISFIYIYLIKTFPSYNPNMLLYIYDSNPNKFITRLTKCLSYGKNQKNLVNHLFLEKEEKNDIKYFPRNNSEFDKNYISDKMISYLSKYLIDMTYSENSFLYEYIQENINNENSSNNTTFLNNLVFNYNPPDQADFNSLNLYNKILQVFSKNFTFYGYLNENEELNNDTKRMIKKINIVEKLIEYSSEKDITLLKEDYSSKYLSRKNFFNLYNFFIGLKSQNKKIFSLGKNNIYFLEETFNIFIDIYHWIINGSISNILENELNDKKQFVIEGIKEFFDDFIHDKKSREIYLNKVWIYNDRVYNILVEFIKYYNNIFYEKISKASINKNELNNHFKDFNDVICFLFKSIKNKEESNRGIVLGKSSKSRKKLKLRIDIFKNTFEKLFEKDINLFFDLLNIYYNEYKSSKEEQLKIIILAIKLNAKKFFDNKTRNNSLNINEIEKDLDKRYIIEYLLNNVNYDIYSKLELVNNSKIFNNNSNAIYLLNNIYKKDASLFVYKKISNCFSGKNNKERFIEFIKNTINNNFIYEHLLSSLNKNELEEIFNTNNIYQKIIISSLFKYSSINSYYILKDLLNRLSSYISKEQFLSIIYNPNEEPIISPSEYDLENINITEEKKLNLLTFSLKVKFVPNYESIAIILSFCKFPEGIIKIMEFLNIGLNLNFSHFRCFNFFSGIKNKEKIKSLENNFYNLITLSQQIINNNKILIEFTDMEKFIFNNIIKIFVFDITPRELMLLTETDIPENRVKNIKNDENKLFILLALFEIKGLPILPIKKYFPSFYAKVEKFFVKAKEIISIEQICLKQPSDVKLYEKLKLLLQENNCNYIIENFPLFKNLLTIFLLEKKQDLSLNLDNEKLTTIHKLIIDLINNNNILPFYDNNAQTDFFKSIFSINDKIQDIEIMNSYKLLIDSLFNFYQTSDIIIQNNEAQKEKYKWNNKNNELNIYVYYLDSISNICRFVVFDSDENKNFYNVNYYVEELSEENKNIINNLKNSINLEQIILNIIHRMEIIFDENEFANCIKNWINNFIKNNSLIKDLSNEKPKNILSYFKYLNICCNVILKIINQLDNLRSIKNALDDIKYIKPSNLNINYYYNSNKDFAKKNTKESFYNLGKNLLKEIENKKKLINDYNIKENVQGNISIYFYFNEEQEKFVECYTDNDLIKFIEEKTKLIFDFIDISNVDNIVLINENNLNEKKMNLIFDELCLTIKNKLEENNKDGTLTIFNSFLKENKDFICKYLEDTAFDINQPNFADFERIMRDKMKQVLFNYIYPCISFNKLLFKICENNYFKLYVDFTELITSIKETKFNPDENLNSSFQLQAIYFLIYDNSNLNLFILDLYNKICKKSRKRHIYEIKDCFKIKLDQGGKKNFEKIKSEYQDTISDINSIISNHNITGKKLKLKSFPNFINSKKKMFYSVVSINPAKREKMPTISWESHIPQSENFVGKTIGQIMKNVFDKRFIIKNGSDYKNKTIGNKQNNCNINSIKEKYTIIYEYLFSIKYVDNEKNIHICQNDISEILKDYSSKKEFISLLNLSGAIEKKWKNDFDLDDIKINYKFP